MDYLFERISKYNIIIIHGHIRPDGDCYGAQIGLKEIILKKYPDKEVYVVGEKSENLSFIGEMDEIEDYKYVEALAIVVDTAIKERISDKRYKSALEVIKVDHHITGEQYGDYQIVEKISSCCEMFARLIYDGLFDISLEGASALYTGMVTDTGRFRFKGVNGHTLRIAGRLIDYGAKPFEIDSKLSEETLDTLYLKGYVISNLKTTENGFVYAILTRDIIKKLNVSDEDAANIVSLLGNIKGFPVWALFIEYPTEIRIRIRSIGPRIDLLAEKYKGGGHTLASGAMLRNWEEIDDFIKDADEVAKEYGLNNGN